MANNASWFTLSSLRWGISLLIGIAIGVGFGFNHRNNQDPGDPHLLSQIPTDALNTDRQKRLNLKWLPSLNPPLGDDNPALLSFWASWCYPCLVELPDLNQLAARFKDQGLRVILVNVDNPKDLNSARDHFEENVKELPFLHDRQFKLSQSLRIELLPYHFLITGNGQIFARWTGAMNWQSDELQQSIKSFLEKPEALAASLR